jgi:hypothetical protein
MKVPIGTRTDGGAGKGSEAYPHADAPGSTTGVSFAVVVWPYERRGRLRAAGWLPATFVW